MNDNLIQVLWVEDDPEITLTYPLEAANYGLELVLFKCWEDAEKALRSEFKRWSAIILDAKCKYKCDSHDNAAQFLTQAIHAIDMICSENHRIIPWFILSGGSENEINDLIIDSREEWDGDWEKKYYSKTTDRELLFHRIPYRVRLSPELQVRTVYNADVFKAIRSAGMDIDIESYMEDLLLPITSYNYSGKEYNNRMTLVRKCIELIFQSMAQYGLLPNKKQGNKYVLNDILVDRRGGINNTWCSLIITGKNVRDKDGKNILIKSNKNILPNVLKDSFQRLIEISSANEHAMNKDADDSQKANSRQTSAFLESINNAPYLLKGMTMELCCIILWYANYIEEHNDEEINALNWDINNKNDMTSL